MWVGLGEQLRGISAGHLLISATVLLSAILLIGSAPDGYWYCWNTWQRGYERQELHHESQPNSNDHPCTRFEVWFTNVFGYKR